METWIFHLTADLGPVTEAECCTGAPHPLSLSPLGHFTLPVRIFTDFSGETSLCARTGNCRVFPHSWHRCPVRGLYVVRLHACTQPLVEEARASNRIDSDHTHREPALDQVHDVNGLWSRASWSMRHPVLQRKRLSATGA